MNFIIQLQYYFGIFCENLGILYGVILKIYGFPLKH